MQNSIKRAIGKRDAGHIPASVSTGEYLRRFYLRSHALSRYFVDAAVPALYGVIDILAI
jgi:hypothetical protein